MQQFASFDWTRTLIAPCKKISDQDKSKTRNSLQAGSKQDQENLMTWPNIDFVVNLRNEETANKIGQIIQDFSLSVLA